MYQVGGLVISQTYMDRLSENINDDLQLQKEVKLGDIAVKYDLPPAFLIGVGYTY